MLTIAYYFLQVVLCSGLLMAYYLLVLRNKRFHQYNRFYLLAAALLSCIVPLVKIQWSHNTLLRDPQMIRLLSVVADGNSQMDKTISESGFQWSWNTAGMWVYLLVSAVLLAGMLSALYRIYRLLKQHSYKPVEDVFIIFTRAAGTPFSFFRYIFWNEEIDLRSEAGKQILQHELAHVRQKHSFDKLFIQFLLIICWFNPFFWLIKREMDMIHEFIADKKAVQNGDTASLAQMLLMAAYPQQKFVLGNPFFFSPIKRRLKMLTNTSDPTFTYIRRLIVLPLLALVVILFSFRSKAQRDNAPLSVTGIMLNLSDAIKGDKNIRQDDITVQNMALLSKEYTVVIDAGHGGKDPGAVAADGTSEAAINLQLAKLVKSLNNNSHINIILRRDNDVTENVKQVAESVNEVHPDLFISLHMNGDAAPGHKARTGVEFFIPSKEKAFDYQASQLLATDLARAITPLHEPFLGIKTRAAGIYVLSNVKSPSVLIEMGSLSEATELAKWKDEKHLEKTASLLLNGINTYFLRTEKTGSRVVTKDNELKLMPALLIDTIPVTKSPVTLRVHRVDSPSIAVNRIQVQVKEDSTRFSDSTKNPLFIVNGVNRGRSHSALSDFSPDDIERIEVLKDKATTGVYGPSAQNGVILITTRAPKPYDEPASFPGGDAAWKKYLDRNLEKNIVKKNGGPNGKYTVVVSFTVSEDGEISDIHAENDPGYGTRTEAERMIQKGPKWKPATKDNKGVKSGKKVSISFFVGQDLEVSR